MKCNSSRTESATEHYTPGRLLRFLQTYTPGKYFWVTSMEGKLALTNGVPIGVCTEWCRYNALARPELLRDFVALGQYLPVPTRLQEEIVKFANNYGPLGVEMDFVDLNGRLGWGERYEVWYDGILKVYLAADLWDKIKAARGRDLEPLKRCIRWTDAGVNYVSELEVQVRFKDEATGEWKEENAPIMRGIVASEKYNPEIWDKLTPHGVIKAARFLLREWVNEALKRSLDGVLLWGSRTPGEGEFVLHFQPSNLLAAIWCLLAREIAINEPERACKYCGKALSKHARKDKRFCDNRCRALYSRMTHRICSLC